MKKGISLIVLVITIIVIIILAGAVILSLANNNPIKNANEAVFMSDMQNYQDALTLYIVKEYYAKGNYDISGVTLEETGIDVKAEYIQSGSSILTVQNGKVGVDPDKATQEQKEWADKIAVLNKPLPKITITFYVGEYGTLSPTTVDIPVYSKLPSVPTPTATDEYDFGGWYTSGGCKLEVDENSIFGGNTTVYASWPGSPGPGSWPPGEMYVIFNPNGGTVSTTEMDIGANNKLTSLPTPTRDGYNFVGWFTSQTGGIKITTSTTFINDDNEVYAHWTANP